MMQISQVVGAVKDLVRAVEPVAGISEQVHKIGHYVKRMSHNVFATGVRLEKAFAKKSTFKLVEEGSSSPCKRRKVAAQMYSPSMPEYIPTTAEEVEESDSKANTQYSPSRPELWGEGEYCSAYCDMGKTEVKIVADREVERKGGDDLF